MRKTDYSSPGEWALHVDCPWRIDHRDRGILTGSSDWTVPANEMDANFEAELGGILNLLVLTWNALLRYCSEGAFSIHLFPVGIRRTLVIGRGKQPVKVVGVDVTVGEALHMGTVDLRDVCPK